MKAETETPELKTAEDIAREDERERVAEIVAADHEGEEPIVKADHVRMVFNIASEQLHSLKEYFIAIVKHELYFKEFIALDDISFQVYPGEVFGLMGTNGSGKSTMLKIIAGVLEPSSGSCYARGVIAPLIELGAGFDMELTARENIFLNGALLGYSKQYITEHFDEIVDFAEVGDFLEMPLKNYSSGMVARIAFAIATVIIPDILIVDEALSVGDQFFQEKCERRIKKLIDEYHVTVLFVSHSTEQVRRICRKAIWIEKGEMRMIGTADEVCNAYSYRLEGIQVLLAEKNSTPDEEHLPEQFAYTNKTVAGLKQLIKLPKYSLPKGRISYSVHIPYIGWLEDFSEGEAAGVHGEERRHVEEIMLSLKDQQYPGGVAYNANIQDLGWQHPQDIDAVDSWNKDGEMIGADGKRMEQIQIALTGEMAEHYDVYYRVFSRGFDWMDWKKNGEIAGIEPFASTLNRERQKSKGFRKKHGKSK